MTPAMSMITGPEATTMGATSSPAAAALQAPRDWLLYLAGRLSARCHSNVRLLRPERLLDRPGCTCPFNTTAPTLSVRFCCGQTIREPPFAVDTSQNSTTSAAGGPRAAGMATVRIHVGLGLRVANSWRN
jgi:hypothetical protein